MGKSCVGDTEQLPIQSPYLLMKAMERVVHRQHILQPYETQVTIKEISVEDRVEVVFAQIHQARKEISFEDLCADCTTLHLVIVTFLSILDLIHQKRIVYTINDVDEIWVQEVQENG